MTSKIPSEIPIQRLKQLRPLLLGLHKALLDSERRRYEQQHGPIQNSGEFFQLVLSHDDFDWLRPLSQLIVQIDESLSPRNALDDLLAAAPILLEKVRLMLKPAETSSVPLEQKYFQAIQREPDIALMHADIMQLVKPKSESP